VLLEANLYIAHLDHDADRRQVNLIRAYLAAKRNSSIGGSTPTAPFSSGNGSSKCHPF
jgi:hypothetical protein